MKPAPLITDRDQEMSEAGVTLVAELCVGVLGGDAKS